MRFKLDENLPLDLRIMLQNDGHDVADVVGEGLGGEDDPPVARAASDERRVLLTFDLDFADIRSYPPGSHAGIMVFRLRDQRWKTLERFMRRVLVETNLLKLEGALVIVSETRIRYKRP